ncbi:MAG: hypothetical protein FJW93_02560 [Actinobacteria bacterium]|nr:hypothetical protein [Actinomycetota bacterium]MBM3815725.1 hypothetical protein [Actinomycetota bacterium]
MTTYDRDITVRCNPITLLRDEWQRINYCQRSLHDVNSWQLRSERFHSLDEVLKAAGFDGHKCDQEADQVLATIVRRAATDQLAARIVLQRVFPPMLAIAKRRGKIRSLGFDYAFSLVLSHAWEVIRTYPIERRPRKIAANIVRDIEYFAFVRRERRRPTHERLDDCLDLIVDCYTTDSRGTAIDRGAREAEPYAEDFLREILNDAREDRVSPHTLAVLESLSNRSIDEFAQYHGISVRTARMWRRDAINELRARMRCAA